MICLSSSALSQLYLFVCTKSITKRLCIFSSSVGLLLYYLSSAVLGCPCRGEVKDFCWRFLSLFKASVFSTLFTRRKSVHLQESNQDAVFEFNTKYGVIYNQNEEKEIVSVLECHCLYQTLIFQVLKPLHLSWGLGIH
jgi:hypothetical protein